MTYNPEKGYTFLVPSGPDPDGKHLYVLLTDRCANDMHLAVSISTVEPGRYYDDACLIQPGEHGFVSDLSFAVYSKAEIFSYANIVSMVSSFTYLIKPPATDALVEKMRGGISVSKRSTPKIRAYYATNRIQYLPTTDEAAD